MYPVDLKYAHSWAIYNLTDFKGHRDGYGRSTGGYWGRIKSTNQDGKKIWIPVTGQDLWSGRINPHRIPVIQDSAPTSSGTWHGSMDCVGKDPNNTVKAAFDGEVLVAKTSKEGYNGKVVTNGTVVIKHQVGQKIFWMFYRHCIPSIGLGDITEGTVIGHYADWAGHTHLSCLALEDLFNYNFISKEEAQGFFLAYEKKTNPRPCDQFSRTKALLPLGIDYLDGVYTYNALRLIDHLEKDIY